MGRFKDSVISNTVHVKATPQGQPEKADSTTAVVTVGTPPAQCPRGFPATGAVTQGPEGATSHAPLGLEAIDIGTSVGTPVYGTVEGTVIGTFGSGLDQIIDVQPTACAGLDVVRYQHLSAVNVSNGQTISFGQRIGSTGDAGTGPHTHYQFNRTDNRSFPIEPPNTGQSVPRTCDGIPECGVTINSAP